MDTVAQAGTEKPLDIGQHTDYPLSVSSLSSSSSVSSIMLIGLCYDRQKVCATAGFERGETSTAGQDLATICIPTLDISILLPRNHDADNVAFTFYYPEFTRTPQEETE
jgi:hypothetical protein